MKVARFLDVALLTPHRGRCSVSVALVGTGTPAARGTLDRDIRSLQWSGGKWPGWASRDPPLAGSRAGQPCLPSIALKTGVHLRQDHSGGWRPSCPGVRIPRCPRERFVTGLRVLFFSAFLLRGPK